MPRLAWEHRDWITLGAAVFPESLGAGTIRTYIAQPGPDGSIPGYTDTWRHMMRMRKAVASGLTALLATAALAGCGDAPESSASGGDGGEDAPAAVDFLPCIVSDAGGFDDKSFNQLGYEGAKQAADELGVELNAVESNSENDYGQADEPNIKPLLYDTAQAAFLGGYLAADYTKTGVVGTYGGLPFPTVTIFMDGFKQGAEYYAKEKGKRVKVVGWDGKDGLFTGGFEANETATNTARQLLDQDVDVILPVGGPIYQGALTAIDASGSDVAMLGVDADLYETDPNTQEVVLTSILKNMKVSTYESLMSAASGEEFDFTPYIGTLENDGVGLAPFHNFEDKVSDTVSDELEQVRAGIIDGSIPVTSYLQGS